MNFITCNEILWVFYEDLQKDADIPVYAATSSTLYRAHGDFIFMLCKTLEQEGWGGFARIEIENDKKNYGLFPLLNV